MSPVAYIITVLNILFYLLNGVSILTGIKWFSLIALITQILNILAYLVVLFFFKMESFSYTRIEILLVFLYRGFVYLKLVAGWGMSYVILFGVVGFFSAVGAVISGIGILLWIIAATAILSKKSIILNF